MRVANFQSKAASRGFTLVEILTCLAVIAIVIGVAIKLLVGMSPIASAAAAQKIEDDLNSLVQAKVIAGSSSTLYYGNAGYYNPLSTSNFASQSYLCACFFYYLHSDILLDKTTMLSGGVPAITETSLSSQIMADATIIVPSVASYRGFPGAASYLAGSHNFAGYGGTVPYGGGVVIGNGTSLANISSPYGCQLSSIYWYKFQGMLYDFGFDSNANVGATTPSLIHIYIRPTVWPNF